VVTLAFCHYCGTNPGVNPESDNLWNGFFDGDTKEYVCWQCRKTHYQKKSVGTRSEMPVVITLTPALPPSRELPSLPKGEEV